MSTIIKIILPVSSEEDLVSVIADVEDIHNNNSNDSVEQGDFNTEKANNYTDVHSNVKHIPTHSSKLCGTPRYAKQIQSVNNINHGHQSQETSMHYRESQLDSVTEQKQQRKYHPSETHEQKIKLSLSQTQHQMSSDVWPQRHVVILDKNARRAPSTTPTSAKVDPSVCLYMCACVYICIVHVLSRLSTLKPEVKLFVSCAGSYRSAMLCGEMVFMCCLDTRCIALVIVCLYSCESSVGE